MEHEIYVSRMGGATVLSSKGLNFYNIEHNGTLIHSNIKATILRQLVIKPDSPEAKFTIKVIDQRPKEKNYNEQRKKESLEQKPKHARI
jgi:hypothetical protein